MYYIGSSQSPLFLWRNVEFDVKISEVVVLLLYQKDSVITLSALDNASVHLCHLNMHTVEGLF
jgi:hypothetical protein